MNPDRAAGRLGKISSIMARRGPDDAGIWSDNAAGATLVFRRLAILDLRLKRASADDGCQLDAMCWCLTVRSITSCLCENIWQKGA